MIRLLDLLANEHALLFALLLLLLVAVQADPSEIGDAKAATRQRSGTQPAGEARACRSESSAANEKEHSQ